VGGSMRAGSVLGGVFASGLRTVPTLLSGIVISGGASLWIFLGPIFKLRTQPEPASD